MPTIIDEESFIDAEEEDRATTFVPATGRDSPALVRPTPESQPPRTPSFFIRSPPMTMPQSRERLSPINSSMLPTFDYATMSTHLKEALHSIGVTWGSEPLFVSTLAQKGFKTIEDMSLMDVDTFWKAFKAICQEQGEHESMTLKVKLKLLRNYIVGVEDTDHVVDWTQISIKKLGTQQTRRALGLSPAHLLSSM